MKEGIVLSSLPEFEPNQVLFVDREAFSTYYIVEKLSLIGVKIKNLYKIFRSKTRSYIVSNVNVEKESTLIYFV